jgi:D-3-phosphoglycerate dehydrogenase / 2-oxoglutarate reductase
VSERAKPKLHWCWPESLREISQLDERLRLRFDMTVRETLPSPEDRVDCLVPSLRHDVCERFMQAHPTLRLIGTPSTGTDHIDVAFANRSDIRVVSLKGETAFLESIQSTAELAWLLILACSRRLREAVEQPLRNQWRAMDVRGVELMGKTIGIIGCGRLGEMVARFAQSFRMRVLVCDTRDIHLDGVTQVSLHELLTRSDVVSIHVPMSDATRHLISTREIGVMKTGSILVNTSRGGVIDESALLVGLESGRIGAVGLDVLDGERQVEQASHPLIDFARRDPRLLVTPHVGGCTFEAQAKAFNYFADRLIEAAETLQLADGRRNVERC